MNIVDTAFGKWYDDNIIELSRIQDLLPVVSKKVWIAALEWLEWELDPLGGNRGINIIRQELENLK
jgi:hypothetical protein